MIVILNLLPLVISLIYQALDVRLGILLVTGCILVVSLTQNLTFGRKLMNFVFDRFNAFKLVIILLYVEHSITPAYLN